MSIQFFCPRWGSEDLGWDSFCQKVRSAGYDGMEIGISHSTTEKELNEVWDLAQKYKLKIIAQHYESYEADFSKHFELYDVWLEKIKPYPCVKVNSQTGRDIFSVEQNSSLIATALQFTGQSGTAVVHETHRHKFSFAAHVTKEYLKRMPELKITLDASHWVCVAESFLEDQPEAMQLALERTDHLHARVGYPEGPQVPDPRAKEWEPAVHRHLEWWDQVAERKRHQQEVLTITPEFGPYPYMVYVPGTQMPLSDQWSVNVFMMELLKKRYL